MGKKMKKISLLFLIICFGTMGTIGSLYSAEKIDFSGLLSGGKIISPPGLYETGKAGFYSRFTDFFDQLGDFLQKNPGLYIEIGGHSDNSGTPAINRRLSLNRAKRVKEYLVKKRGIPGDRILVKGYSSGFPIADNRTDDGRGKNRRVEIIVLKNVDPAGKLTYIRRDVFTKTLATIDFIRARVNQGLFHQDRVLTRKKSNANVTFQDLSKINLGPQSLMIMYSLLEKGLRVPRKQNVKLVTGGLRTKLTKLKGSLQVETPSCTVNSNSIEILVGIDEKKMSSLSVFDGSSTVKAQGKTVEVPGGYGTVVEMGEAPEPPEPLPPAPQLIDPVKTEIQLPRHSNTIPVQFQWLRAKESDSYHLQVASDSQFEKIVEDQILADPGASLSLGVGTHYWRVAAINKRGIEGYAAPASFTITPDKGPSTLPLELTPAPKEIVKTTSRTLTVTGKTVPGARITIKGQGIQVKDNGAFKGRISLVKGWNNLQVSASHPDFKTKTVWLTAYRYPLCEPGLSLGFRFDYATKNDLLDNTFAFQVGGTFCLDSRFEAEFSIGITSMGWQDFPGDYKKDILAVPLTVELHFMLGKGPVTPYLSTGLAAYLAFTEKRSRNEKEKIFFISPEIGGGLSFPVAKIHTRFEVKYAPFLKKEPFFPELTKRLSFILKLIL